MSSRFQAEGMQGYSPGDRPSVAKPGLPELRLPDAAGAQPTARFGCALADGPGHCSSVVPDVSTANKLQV